MAAYQGAKRQKVKEAKDTDYFQGIDKMEYSSAASAGDAVRYRFYSAGERLRGRSMEDWLKIGVALTEFRAAGSDSHGKAFTRPWDDRTDSLENHKRCIKALYEFCAKLGVKYWTAFDTDLVPATDNWDECTANWDEIVEYLGELNQRYHLKLLWLAPDLHSHPRYASGAFTSPDATVFAQAAAQVKTCLETSQRLHAECVLLWPRKEGYSSLFQADVAKELKLFAKLLKIAAEYKDRLNYRCQLLLMPSGDREQYEQQYMCDVTSCLQLLASRGLERHYRVCAPPSPHLGMAAVYNMLGGATISNEVDPCDTRRLTLMMKCIVDQGAAPPGGASLRLAVSGGPRVLLAAHARYIDALARALRAACAALNDHTFSKHLQQRYSSYQSGFGSRIISTDISIEECEEYYKKNQHVSNELSPSKCEHLEIAFQRYLDTSDHI